MSINEPQVRAWLKDHPSEAFKILRDNSISKTASVSEAERISKDSSSSDVFFDVAKIIYSSLDMQTIIENVLAIAGKVINAEKCSVLLADNDTKSLYISAWDVSAVSDTVMENLERSASFKRSTDGFIETDSDKKRTSVCQAPKTPVFKPEYRIPFGVGISGIVAQTRKGLNIKDAHLDPRFNPEMDRKTGFITKSLLCLPIFGKWNDETDSPELLGVASVMNKHDSEDGFDNNDIIKFRNFLLLVGMAISNSLSYAEAIKSQKQSALLAAENKALLDASVNESSKIKVLLEFAMSLYKEEDVQSLNQKIIEHARQLLRADKASVFIVDRTRNELYSSVFDTATNKVIRFPINKGISGYVASSGVHINLTNAYEDDRFNRDVDIQTGYKTQSMLSVPIYGPNKDIVAVANLINKMENDHPISFSDSDVKSFEAFAAFCGVALHKALLLQQTQEQSRVLAVTMELMSYHSSAQKEDIQMFLKHMPTYNVSPEDIRKWEFNPHSYDHDPDGLAIVSLGLFRDLDYIKKYEIDQTKLTSYTLTVRRNYRPVLYHNFGHAVSVSHALYLLIKHDALKDKISELEMFSMFIACLNHDIDHRGTNNAFQKNTNSSLAGFYSTSTMERHHFNHAMTIMTNPNLNILERMSASDFKEFLKYMEEAIIQTDLGMYFAKKGKALELAKSGLYDKNNPEHRSLLKGIMMTCCDLTAMTKSFESSKETANNVYKEFFLQGDEEKKLGLPYSAELMDRSKMGEIPRMQVDFYNFIVFPAFEILEMFLGDAIKPWMTAIRANSEKFITLILPIFERLKMESLEEIKTLEDIGIYNMKLANDLKPIGHLPHVHTAIICFQSLLPSANDLIKVQNIIRICQLLINYTVNTDDVIEDYINMAIRLCKRAQLTNELFKVYNLQLEIMIINQKSCKHFLKIVFNEALELKLSHQIYYFMQKRCTALYQERDWNSLINVLDTTLQYADTNDHETVKEYCIMLKIQFLLYNNPLATKSVEELLAEFFPKNDIINLLFILHKIAFELRKYNFKEAGAHLQLLQNEAQKLYKLEEFSGDEHLTIYQDDHYYLCLNSEIIQHIYLVTYLVSGVIHKNNETAKAKIFLEQGLNFIEKNPEPWNLKIKILFIRHLTEVFILCDDMKSAKENMDLLLNLSADMLETDNMKSIIYLDMGVMNQKMGNIDNSKSLYNAASKCDDKMVRVMANFQLLFLSLDDQNLAASIVKNIEDELQNEDFSFHNSLRKFANGIECFIQELFQPTKSNILDALKSSDECDCSPIKMYSLFLLGSLYTFTNKTQACKMFKTAMSFGLKLKSENMIKLCKKELEGISKEF